MLVHHEGQGYDRTAVTFISRKSADNQDPREVAAQAAIWKPLKEIMMNAFSKKALPVVAFGALMLSSAVALADNGISYSYIQASYQEVDFDGPDGDGYAVGASVEIGDAWFVFADYAASEFDFGADLDWL